MYVWKQAAAAAARTCVPLVDALMDARYLDGCMSCVMNADEGRRPVGDGQLRYCKPDIYIAIHNACTAVLLTVLCCAVRSGYRTSMPQQVSLPAI